MADTKQRLRVLHLVRWYPNRYDPMPGLFIKRHVESAGIKNDVAVVYTHFEKNNPEFKTNYQLEYNVTNGVPTAKVYYKASKCTLNPLRKLINIIRFYRANRIGVSKVKTELGIPDIIHIHILTRLGLIGLYYKLRYNIPYVITEHWSRYLPVTGSFKGIIRKFLTRIVVNNAFCVTAVTQNLASAMQSHRLQNKNYTVLPNVVDNIFIKNTKPEKSAAEKITFVHISCFEDRSKNISGLLRVISDLAKMRNDFKFLMIGDGQDMPWLQDYADENNLTNKFVEFKGLLEGEQLVKEMSSADMLVVFSNYENFPVVINECLSMGIPVITTKVGGIPERINSDNGILIDQGNESQLLAGLNNFLDNKVRFNMEEVRSQSVGEFSPEAVGAKLDLIYRESLGL